MDTRNKIKQKALQIISKWGFDYVPTKEEESLACGALVVFVLFLAMIWVLFV